MWNVVAALTGFGTYGVVAIFLVATAIQLLINLNLVKTIVGIYALTYLLVVKIVRKAMNWHVRVHCLNRR